jgi:endonuclease V-like protein UPF0215 family
MKEYRKEIRLLGIDDSPFDKFKDKECLVIGTVYRGGNYADGILSTKVKVDGDDSTAKLALMINKSKFRPQLRCILINGIAVAGFNVIDIRALNKKTRIPVIVVARDYPRYADIYSALKKLGMPGKYKIIEKAGKPQKIGKVYVQMAGISLNGAREILKISATHSFVPEPIRLAHLIAGGVARGESRGNA